MKSCRAEIESVTPLLRQLARGLVEGGRADIADDLVHDAIAEALRWDGSVAAQDVQHRLLMRLIGANRQRLREAMGERMTAPVPASNAESRSLNRAVGYAGAADGVAGLDALSLNDREALLLVVLARLDYQHVAEIIGVPMSTLVTRLVRAREALGASLWAERPARRPGATGHRPNPGHLRLVKTS